MAVCVHYIRTTSTNTTTLTFSLLSYIYNINCRTCDGTATHCQSKEVVKMELEVVSTHPRALIVDRFLSDHETDEIIKLAKPGMTESQVGQ